MFKLHRGFALLRETKRFLGASLLTGVAAAAVCLTANSAVKAAPGDLDATFGVGGKASLNIDSSSAIATAMARQPDGKILVAGHVSNSPNFNDFVLARFNADGTVDTGFGTAGRVMTTVSANQDFCRAIAVQPDGKIIAVGTSLNDGSRYLVAIVRYNADGTLDTSFGSGGIVITPSTLREEGNAVMLLANGQFVVGGLQRGSSTGYDFALLKYNNDGSLDASFGVNGKAVTAVASGNRADEAKAIVLQPDGKFVAAGYSQSDSGDFDFAAVRFNPNGTLDTTFGNAGKVVTIVGSLRDVGNAIALQADGKIVVAGSSETESFVSDFALVRYNADGTLDAAFGNNGKTTTAVGSADDVAYGVALQSDGKVLVAGYSETFFEDFALLRYNSNGVLDAKWGNGGKVLTDFDQLGDEGKAVMLTPDGKVIVAGTVGNGKFGAARYSSSNAVSVNRINQFDFDGDERDDLGVFRNGVWYVLHSSTNQSYGVEWGLGGDRIAPADYDGDNKTDFAVWRDEPSDPERAHFYILNSSNNTARIEQFGQSGDIPQPGDWDGDGKADLAVYREAINGEQSNYFYRPSSQPTIDFNVIYFGLEGDKPLRGDFDGDGKFDAAVFRPSDELWYVRQSSNGEMRYERWGSSVDKLAPADYDGDGKTDVAVFRDGTWYIKQSLTNQPRYEQFGLASDIVLPADYDGDGRDDLGVFRNGVWYVSRSSNGAIFATQFGTSKDTPVESAYLP